MREHICSMENCQETRSLNTRGAPADQQGNASTPRGKRTRG